MDLRTLVTTSSWYSIWVHMSYHTKCHSSPRYKWKFLYGKIMIDGSVACWEVLPWGLPSRWGQEEWCAWAPSSHASHLCLLIGTPVHVAKPLCADALWFWFSSQELFPWLLTLSWPPSLCYRLVTLSWSQNSLFLLIFSCRFDHCESAKLSHISLHILLLMPGSQKNLPQNMQPRILWTMWLALTLKFWYKYRWWISQFILGGE